MLQEKKNNEFSIVKEMEIDDRFKTIDVAIGFSPIIVPVRIKTLTPITHGIPLPVTLMNEKKSNIIRFRRHPYFLPSDKGEWEIRFIPCITGGIRGPGRRTLMRRTFILLGLGDPLSATVEGLNLEGKNEKIEWIVLLRTFFGGGTSEESSDPISEEYYRNLRVVLPFLDLLGGVYRGHHFNGTMSVRDAVIITQETKHLVHPELLAKDEQLPGLNELEEMLNTNEKLLITFSKAVSYYGSQDLYIESEVKNEKATDGELNEAEPQKENIKVKDRGLYSLEVMPAGISFGGAYTLHPDAYVNTIPAFYAFIKYLNDMGRLGGKRSYDYGIVEMTYGNGNSNDNIEEKIKNGAEEYETYIIEHKNEILDVFADMIGTLKGKKKRNKKKDKNNNGKENNNKKEEKKSEE